MKKQKEQSSSLETPFLGIYQAENNGNRLRKGFGGQRRAFLE